jgi:transmembrane sensor
MSDTFDWRIIDRTLAGEATAADDAALQRWLADDARHAALLDALRAQAASGGIPSHPKWNVDAAWARVSSRIDDAAAARPLTLRPPRIERATARAGLMRRVLVPASVLAAAGLLALLWRPAHVAAPFAPNASAMHEVVAADGQQTRVTLHDGTHIVLNAGSRLRYGGDYGRTARDVQLDGEGYFDVVHDASRPFRVHTRGDVAEDLGTRFVVRAYLESPHVDVIVEQGRVALRRDVATSRAATLGAHQLGRVEPDGSVTVVDSADVERWLGWTHGVLALDGLSLTDAATEIGRRFDAHVVVDDSLLAKRHVSARFRDESLPRVLDALTLAMGARWTRDGQHIVITRADR